MDINKLKDVIENCEHKSNKDLFDAKNELKTEFDKTKKLIIDLTYHMENLEEMYIKINDEIEKRTKL